MDKTKSYTLKEALLALSRYCVYQDRCHQEVEQKLKSMNMIPEAQALIISELIKDDFLNEERFAMNYAWGKFNQKSWGKIKIRQELKRRHISDYLLQKALNQFKEDVYRNKLHELAVKKFNQLGKSQTWTTKSKLKNYLTYRGYEIELIIDEINSLIKT